MRYFLGFFATILLIFLLIFLLFSGDKKPKAPTGKTLDSYAATDAEVRLTTDGPVNAEEQHKQVRISVNRQNVTFEHIGGYNGNIVKRQQFNNTENAYTAFLLSLAHAGFTRTETKPDPALRDERGYCPEGDRYVFELVQNDKDVLRSWATSCDKPKTYLGAVGLTLDLFQAQVPNYSDLTQDIVL